MCICINAIRVIPTTDRKILRICFVKLVWRYKLKIRSKDFMTYKHNIFFICIYIYVYLHVVRNSLRCLKQPLFYMIFYLFKG